MNTQKRNLPKESEIFPSYAHKFNQRTFHIRLINLYTSDKKSSYKIRHKETPRVHEMEREELE